MEITQNTTRVRCELGACRNRAEHAVRFDRVGIRSRLYVCDKCLHELYDAIGATVVPKSIETAKPRAKKEK
ncbi:MAG: hypothetical protein J1G38_03230 [Clostridiales bacterium]|nr:hypothetical protein [Clostridiales bacterium]